MSAENQDAVLKRLDEELGKQGEKRSLIACDGSVLIMMDVTDRGTRDLDVVFPKIDPVLQQAAKRVGSEFGLADNWLNDGPSSLSKELTAGWRSRTVTIFQGDWLELRALDRKDLLATKLYAFCDREDDFDDVVKLKPSHDELNKLMPWVLARDASDLWPERVRSCFSRLRKRLAYE